MFFAKMVSSFDLDGHESPDEWITQSCSFTHSKFHCFNADCFLVTCFVSLEQLMLEFAHEIIDVPGLHACSCVPTVEFEAILYCLLAS
jgi:hypothetical protein